MRRAIDGVDYKVWKLPHPLLLHWVLNPGLAINELVLGQRMPRETLIKDGQESLNERSYVQCPPCETVHHGVVWAKGRAFGHYNGIYCPTCEAKIPQLLNVFSILILLITFPFWKPLQMIYGERIKARSIAKTRLDAKETEAVANEPINFLLLGAIFGSVMGLYFIITESMRSGFGLKAIAFALPAAIVSGLFFGGIMWLFLRGKKAKP